MASMPIVKKEPRKSFGFLDTKRDRFHDEAWAAVEGDLISHNIYMYKLYSITDSCFHNWIFQKWKGNQLCEGDQGSNNDFRILFH